MAKKKKTCLGSRIRSKGKERSKNPISLKPRWK